MVSTYDLIIDERGDKAFLSMILAFSIDEDFFWFQEDELRFERKEAELMGK